MKAMQILKYSTELSSLLVICVSLFWAYSRLSPLLVYSVVALQLRLLLMHGSRVCSTVNALLGRIILIVNKQQNTPNTAALWVFFLAPLLLLLLASLLSACNTGFLAVLWYGRTSCLRVHAQVSLIVVF